MAKVELIGNLWIVFGAFVGNVVGGLLASYSLSRAGTRRTVVRRAVFLAIATWALVESALYDMLFVATTGLRVDGVQARFFLVPILLASFVAIAASTAVLLLVLYRPHLVVIYGGGLLIGVAIAYGCFEAIYSIRTGGPVGLDGRSLVLIGLFSALTTGLALVVALRRPWRLAPVVAALMFAAITTATQIMSLDAVTFGRPGGQTEPVGFLPIEVIIPITIAFLVRLLVLAGVMATEFGATPTLAPSPSHPA